MTSSWSPPRRRGLVVLVAGMAALAVAAVRARDAQRQPRTPDWRAVGGTPDGDVLEIDVAGIPGQRGAYAVRMRPGAADTRVMIVRPDCRARTLGGSRLHETAFGLTARVIALACDEGR